MYDVISIGAATVDIFAKSDDFIVRDQLLSLQYSSKNEINKSLICSGGGATNSSVSFSRLGLKSGCLALIGVDQLSEFVLNDLKENLISTSLLIKSPKSTTDFSVILVAADGSRSILTERGKTGLIEKQIPWGKLKTKWFYITSLEGNIDLLEKIIGFAQESNIKIALNPGNRELHQKKMLIPLLKYVDFLLLNQTETEILFDANIDHSLIFSKLNKFGPKITAITNGRHGANIFYQNHHHHSTIQKVNTVDETGAGDSFGSAFVSALIHQLTPIEALNWGVKNSASVVSQLGAKSGLLTLKQIKNVT